MNDKLAEIIAISDNLAKKGDLEGALSSLSSYIIYDPSQAIAYALRGHSYFSLERFKDAKADFDRALALHSDAPNTLFMRARCNEELDHLENAKIDYAEVIALSPETGDAYLNLGMILEFENRIKEAIAIYNLAPRSSPSFEQIKLRLEALG